MTTIIPPHYYMDASLDFGEEDGEHGIDIEQKNFKFIITQALKTVYGDCGYGIPVDVLKYKDEDRRAFLRFPSKDLVKVWSALTLFSRYEGIDCAFRVHKVSPVLAQLSVNSCARICKTD